MITGDITKDGGNFSIQGNGMRLQIEPMTLEAEGMYKCVAENSEGKDEKSGYLTVHGKKILLFMTSTILLLFFI